MKKFWQKQTFKKLISQFTLSNKRPILLFSFFLLLITGFLLTSCKDELSSDLGSNLLPGSDSFTVLCDSSTVIFARDTASTPLIVQNYNTGWYKVVVKSKIDTTKDSTTYVPYYYSSFTHNLLGEYRDEAFGYTSASLLFQLTPEGYHSKDTSLNANATFVSLTLHLAKSDTSKYAVIGSSNAIQTLQVFTLKSTINPSSDSTYNSAFDLKPYIDENNQIPIENPVYVPDTKNFKYTFSFKIKDEVLINKLMNIDATQMKSRDTFNIKTLKGFYITSSFTDPLNTTKGGIISSLNLASDSSFLELKYKNSKDTGNIIHSYKFFASAFPMGISKYTADAVKFNTDDYVYLNGLDYNCIKINLQNIEKLRSIKPISIQKAELILTPDSVPSGIAYNNLPKRLSIYVKGEKSDDIIIDEQASKSLFFDGYYRNNSYHFYITKYLQNFVKDNNTTKNLGLLLKVYNSPYNGYFDAGRLAIKKNNGMKLKIYYTTK